MGDRRINFLLAVGTTTVCLFLGIWVSAYLTVWPAPQSSEGDALVLFDPEIGMAPNRNAHTRRVYPSVPRRPAPLIFDVYTDDRGSRVDGPGIRNPSRGGLMVIGGSVSWGYALRNSVTYARRLARTLDTSVVNLSGPGFGSVQALQMLRRNRDLAPKIVIYGIIAHHYERNVSACAPSDYPFCLDVSHVAWDKAGEPFIAPPASNGVRRIEQHVKRAGFDPMRWLVHGLDVIYGRVTYGIAVRTEPLQANKDEALAFILRKMERVVAGVGGHLVVVYVPTNYWASQPSLPVIAKEIGGRLHYLDLTERFKRNRAQGGPEVYIRNDGHPTAAAHAIMAEEIEALIRRENLLP